MKNTLIVLIIGFLLYACERPKTCTLMYCRWETPFITVKLDGFDETDLSRVSILMLDVVSLRVKDSLIFSNGETNTYSANEYKIGGTLSGIKDINNYVCLIKQMFHQTPFVKLNTTIMMKVYLVINAQTEDMNIKR